MADSAVCPTGGKPPCWSSRRRYNCGVGQGILTGQAAPPAQPYSLRADLGAWRAALGGLRDNPLLTHLRLAERRRLSRIPRWRRNLPLLLALGASLFSVNLLDYIAAYTIYSVNILYYSIFIVNIFLVYSLWLLQGVFNAVLGALGVLGRSGRRPNHLVLDDFAALTNLNDHEIAAGAAASLLPPIAVRIAVGSLLLVTMPAWKLVSEGLYPDWAQSNTGSHFSFYGANLANSTSLAGAVQVVLLGPVTFILGAIAALALIMWFICLGRSINIEKIGIIAASTIALSQVAYPAALLYLQMFADWGFLQDVQDVFDSFVAEALIAILLWLLAPSVVALMLALARRLPWLRAALTMLSPLALGAVLALLPFMFIILIDAAAGNASSTSYLNAIPSIVALAVGGLAVLAPQTIVASGWADGAYTMPTAITAVLLLLPMQLCMLYVTSRFAVEAVGARRRRGD